MNKLVSYYELLGMTLDGKIPEKVIYKEDTYFWKGKRYQQTENGQFLSDMDETEMFDKNIEIPNDDFEDIKSFGIHYSWDYIDYKNIEKLKKYVNKDFQNIFDTLDKLINNQKKIINILKEK